MRIANIKDEGERKVAEVKRAAATDARARNRKAHADRELEAVNEKKRLYAVVHGPGGGVPTNEDARAWATAVGGIKKARELAAAAVAARSFSAWPPTAASGGR